MEREFGGVERKFGQIHIYEVSLRGRRETSGTWRDFCDGEKILTNTYLRSLTSQGETSENI
jgi:hypothetical protein